MKQSDTSFSTLTKTLETASLIIKPLYYLHFSLEHWTNLHLGDLMKQRNRRPRSPFRSPFVFWRICPTTGSGCQATAAPLSICRIADWQGWFQLGRQSSSHSERPSTSPCLRVDRHKTECPFEAAHDGQRTVFATNSCTTYRIWTPSLTIKKRSHVYVWTVKMNTAGRISTLQVYSIFAKSLNLAS